MSKMKANPGGEIDPKMAVGRDGIVQTIWETVEQQSVRLTAERRIGKTVILKILQDAPKKGWNVVFHDFEKCHSAMEFAQAVHQDVVQFLSTLGWVARRSQKFLEFLCGTDFNGFKLQELPKKHWKELLAKAFEDLAEHQAKTNQRLLFLWDEFPTFIMNLRDWESPRTAMEMLDVLREVRQTTQLRMVMTGSIGLHHVMSSLKAQNYTGEPTNDTYLIEVKPLLHTDAIRLAKTLLAGEEIACSDPTATSQTIAEESDCFPYYIHHIVKALKLSGGSASSAVVKTLVLSQLVDENDPWELDHYRTRIRTYYEPNHEAAFLILDHFALAPAALTVNVLQNALKGDGVELGRTTLLELLGLLAKDHYLSKSVEGHYQWRFNLIRRWWKLAREL